MNLGQLKDSILNLVKGVRHRLLVPCRFSPVTRPGSEIMLDAIYQDAEGRSDSFDKLLIEALAGALSAEVA